MSPFSYFPTSVMKSEGVSDSEETCSWGCEKDWEGAQEVHGKTPDPQYPFGHGKWRGPGESGRELRKAPVNPVKKRDHRPKLEKTKCHLFSW